MGSSGFGFCPSKVARDDIETLIQFKELIMISEFKVLPYSGGLYEQDSELIDLLTWFFPSYELMRFAQKAVMILGDGSETSKTTSKPRSSRKIR